MKYISSRFSVPMRHLRVRPISTLSELIESAELVHRKYVEFKLMKPRASGMRFFIRDLITPSITFGVWEDDRLIASASLNANIYCPLPGFLDYSREISSLGNCIIIESTKFACDDKAASAWGRGLGKMSLPATLLLRALYQWCFHHKFEWWLLILHPRVQSMYERNLGFAQLGRPVPCSVAEYAPGVLLGLNIQQAWEKRHKLPIDGRSWVIEGPQLFPLDSPVFVATEKDVAALLERDPGIIEESPPEEWVILRRHFPGITLPFIEKKIGNKSS